MHLRGREKNLDKWLEHPVLLSEVRSDERRQLRHAALMRGEIPT